MSLPRQLNGPGACLFLLPSCGAPAGKLLWGRSPVPRHSAAPLVSPLFSFLTSLFPYHLIPFFLPSFSSHLSPFPSHPIFLRSPVSSFFAFFPRLTTSDFILHTACNFTLLTASFSFFSVPLPRSPTLGIREGVTVRRFGIVLCMFLFVLFIHS